MNRNTADYKSLQKIERERIVKNHIQFRMNKCDELSKGSDQLFQRHTVGCGIPPHQRLRSQAVTAGQGFHLAPKIFI